MFYFLSFLFELLAIQNAPNAGFSTNQKKQERQRLGSCSAEPALPVEALLQKFDKRLIVRHPPNSRGYIPLQKAHGTGGEMVGDGFKALSGPTRRQGGVGREAVMGEKGERPERVFPGRTDPWFIAAMVIVAGGLSAACIACFLSSSPALLWGWLALLPIPALVALAALPVRSNRLELYGDRLVVVYAGTRSVIPYAHVRGVRRTRTLWAGTANSLDRVYIEAPYDGDAIVSVRDNDALVAELGRRCGLGPGA